MVAKISCLIHRISEDSITCSIFPCLSDFRSVGNVKGRSSSFKEFLQIYQTIFMNDLARSQEKLAFKLGDPEFVLHTIRLSIQDADADKNVGTLFPIWHMTTHAFECLVGCLPCCLILLLPKIHLEGYNSSVFNQALNKKMHQMLQSHTSNTSRSSLSDDYDDDLHRIGGLDAQDPDILPLPRPTDFATFSVHEILASISLDTDYACADAKAKKESFRDLYEVFQLFSKCSSQQLWFTMQAIAATGEKVRSEHPDPFAVNATTRLISRLLNHIENIEECYFSMVCNGKSRDSVYSIYNARSTGDISKLWINFVDWIELYSYGSKPNIFRVATFLFMQEMHWLETRPDVAKVVAQTCVIDNDLFIEHIHSILTQRTAGISLVENDPISRIRKESILPFLLGDQIEEWERLFTECDVEDGEDECKHSESEVFKLGKRFRTNKKMINYTDELATVWLIPVLRHYGGLCHTYEQEDIIDNYSLLRIGNEKGELYFKSFEEVIY